MDASQKICVQCILPASFPGISFDEKGVCSVCNDYKHRWEGWELELPKRKAILKKICYDARSKRRHFDALITLSGGKDSTYVLYKAVKDLGLHCLAFTLDNGYLSEHACANIDRACRLLGVEHIYYRMDPVLLNRLYTLFMKKTGYFCSVCMRAIGMSTQMVADIYNIPLVINGTSARTELVLFPEMFQPGPVSYIRNVLRDEPIAAECKRLLYGGTLRRQIGYWVFRWDGQNRVRLCAVINLPDYMEWNYDTVYQTIKNKMGWQVPSANMEHTDCSIHPITTYLHNRRFPGLEIRRLTMARLIMAGQLSREEAIKRLNEEPEEGCPEQIMRMFLRNLSMSREDFDRYIDMGARHLQFRPRPNPAFVLARKLKRALTPNK